MGAFSCGMPIFVWVLINSMWLLSSKWVPILMGCLFCVGAYYPNFTVGGCIFKREEDFFAITSFDIGIWMVVLLLRGVSIPAKSYSGRHFIQVSVVV